MAKKLKFAVVKWLDASMDNPHWTQGSLPALPTEKANTMLSAGFLAHDTKKFVVLVQTLGQGIHANSVEIPRAMIMEMKTID